MSRNRMMLKLSIRRSKLVSLPIFHAIALMNYIFVSHYYLWRFFQLPDVTIMDETFTYYRQI